MNDAAFWLSRAVELAGAIMIGWVILRNLGAFASERGSEAIAERMRIVLAHGVIGALGLMSAAALLKTVGLRDRSSTGMFAVILSLRLLIRRSFAGKLRPAAAPPPSVPSASARSGNRSMPAQG